MSHSKNYVPRWKTGFDERVTCRKTSRCRSKNFEHMRYRGALMSHTRPFLPWSSLLLRTLPALSTLLFAQQPLSAPPMVERGSFVLHKFEQAIGKETYEISKEGDSLEVRSDFKFKDRFTEVPLTSKLVFAADLTPRSLELKGKNSRFNPIDDGVTVEGKIVHIRVTDATRGVAAPDRFFLIPGYAPT